MSGDSGRLPADEVVRRFNSNLAGATVLRRFEFVAEPTTGRCNVFLELLDHDARPTRVVTVRASGVSGFRTAEWGGGLTQLPCLRVSRAELEQHDRVRFALKELEDDRLSLSCSDLDVVELEVR